MNPETKESTTPDAGSRNRIRVSLLLAIAVGLFCLWVGFFAGSGEARINWVAVSGYWWMLLLVAGSACVWGAVLFRKYRRTPDKKAAGWLLADMAVLALAALALSSLEPDEFKILMDEPLLVGTSYRMDRSGELGVPLLSYWLEDRLVIFQSTLDKRPFLFPFLVSAAHGAAGFRIEHAFLVNSILLVGLVSLVYLLVRGLVRSRVGALAAGLLLLSVPELIRASSGAGFELLNLFCLVLLALGSWYYLASPDRLHGAALLAASLLLAYCRYESVLFVPVAFGFLFWGMWRERRWIWHWSYLLAPVFLIPYLWRHQIFQLNTNSWQMYDRAGVTRPFSLEWIPVNLRSAWSYGFDLTGEYANAYWLLGIAVGCFFAGTIYFCLRRSRFRSPSAADWNAWIFVLLLGGLFLFYLCYFFGQFDDPIISRFSLPFHLLAAVFVVCFFCRLFPVRGQWAALLVALVCLLGFAVPKVAEHRYSKVYFPAYEWHAIRAFLEDYGPVIGRPLVIDRLPVRWVMEGAGSMTVLRANENPDSLRAYIDGKYNGWVLFMEIGRKKTESGKFIPDPFTDAPGDYYILDPVYKKELIWEVSPVDDKVIRIHRVTGVDPFG